MEKGLGYRKFVKFYKYNIFNWDISVFFVKGKNFFGYYCFCFLLEIYMGI